MVTEPRVYVPRPYGKLITDHILEVPRCAVWSTMGSGKTVATLTALDAMFLAGDDIPALVIGPMRVARDVWTNEARKWAHLRHLTIFPIVGDLATRRLALSFKTPAHIHTVNYENLPWLVEHWGDRWPYKIVVGDESTRLKSYRGGYRTNKQGTTYLQSAGGLRSRALAKVAHTHVKHFIELSGTPSPNGLKDLWGQIWFLDAGKRLGHTYEGFSRRWFNSGYGEFTGLTPLPFAQEQIQDRVRDLCLSVCIEDYLDLHKPFINNVYVDLPERARQRYREMEKAMFTEIEGHEIEAFGAAARTQKCLQLANGAAYTGTADDPGERKWVQVHDVKLQALESCVSEAAGMPMIVSYEFKSDAARILKAFPGAVNIATPAGFDKFKTGTAPIGLAHPMSMGHGVEGLQDVTNIITFFGHNWDLELYDQIIGRIGPVRQAQSGHNRVVKINHIIARDTVDEDVMLRRETKRSVQDILIEAMDRRKRNV